MGAPPLADLLQLPGANKSGIPPPRPDLADRDDGSAGPGPPLAQVHMDEVRAMVAAHAAYLRQLAETMARILTPDEDEIGNEEA